MTSSWYSQTRQKYVCGEHLFLVCGQCRDVTRLTHSRCIVLQNYEKYSPIRSEIKMSYLIFIFLWLYHIAHIFVSWWRHQMDTFSALVAICAGNSPVPGEFPAQRPVTRSFDIFFDLRSHKRLSKQWWGWWVETLSPSLWRHRNVPKWF